MSKKKAKEAAELSAKCWALYCDNLLLSAQLQRWVDTAVGLGWVDRKAPIIRKSEELLYEAPDD